MDDAEFLQRLERINEQVILIGVMMQGLIAERRLTSRPASDGPSEEDRIRDLEEDRIRDLMAEAQASPGKVITR